MQQDPYDFITNPAAPPKKPLFSGATKQNRVVIAVTGLLLLLIIGVIISMVISSAGSGSRETLVKASQQQAELVRISKLGLDKSRGTSAKNLAATVNASLTSDQAALTAALSQQRIKVSPKQIALGKNQKTDQVLTAAEQSNKFDEVFTETIKLQLTEYQKTIKSAHDQASSKALKAILAEQFKNANILVAAKN